MIRWHGDAIEVFWDVLAMVSNLIAMASNLVDARGIDLGHSLRPTVGGLLRA